ncbi:hypothetical protein AB8O64_23420 [Streptomyces sp. QH1-20]|uniref:hypothetical protein n=1 Tax=Streptomyces sp. QH1-20 TaxID=3240934 RepID=UPI003516B9AD
MRLLPAFSEIKTADLGKFDQVSLSDGVDHLEPSLREPIFRYLMDSTSLISAGNTSDPLAPGKGPVVPFGFSTDGTWAWPAYWSYFVREYGMALPEEFVAHVRSLDFTPPNLSSEQIEQASAEIQEALYE